jgi:hypothetical protein
MTTPPAAKLHPNEYDAPIPGVAGLKGLDPTTVNLAAADFLEDVAVQLAAGSDGLNGNMLLAGYQAADAIAKHGLPPGRHTEDVVLAQAWYSLAVAVHRIPDADMAMSVSELTDPANQEPALMALVFAIAEMRLCPDPNAEYDDDPMDVALASGNIFAAMGERLLTAVAGTLPAFSPEVLAAMQAAGAAAESGAK